VLAALLAENGFGFEGVSLEDKEGVVKENG